MDDSFDFDQYCHGDWVNVADNMDEDHTARDMLADFSSSTNMNAQTWQPAAHTQEMDEFHESLDQRAETSGTHVSSYPEQTTIQQIPYYGPSSPPHSTSNSPQMAPTSPAADGAGTDDRRSPYPPFQSHFQDSEAAKAYRQTSMRFGRKPYLDPKTDKTIRDIESNRLQHVERIYNAMISGAEAKDNPDSPAMKRWVHEANYGGKMVEAIAHKVIDNLINQVRYGYRGWGHTDYVSDDRKGEDADKAVNCAQRLDNVIRGLAHEKTICEDSMQSASQIRMFVNAPKAYANRKHQNRLGNRKRGQGSGRGPGDDNPKPAKSQRQSNRSRRRQTMSSSATEPQSATPEPPAQRPNQRQLTPSSHASVSPVTNGMSLHSSPTVTPSNNVRAARMYPPQAASFQAYQQLRPLPYMRQTSQNQSYSHEQYRSPPMPNFEANSLPPENSFPLLNEPEWPSPTIPNVTRNSYHLSPTINHHSYEFPQHLNGNHTGIHIRSSNLFEQHPEAENLDQASSGVAVVTGLAPSHQLQNYFNAQNGMQLFDRRGSQDDAKPN